VAKAPHLDFVVLQWVLEVTSAVQFVHQQHFVELMDFDQVCYETLGKVSLLRVKGKNRE
jgi:hypothetical protein